jgi:hypothetical protein
MRNFYYQVLVVAVLTAAGAICIEVRDSENNYNPVLEDFTSDSLGSWSDTADFFRQVSSNP